MQLVWLTIGVSDAGGGVGAGVAVAGARPAALLSVGEPEPVEEGDPQAARPAAAAAATRSGEERIAAGYALGPDPCRAAAVVTATARSGASPRGQQLQNQSRSRSQRSPPR